MIGEEFSGRRVGGSDGGMVELLRRGLIEGDAVEARDLRGILDALAIGETGSETSRYSSHPPVA